MTKFLFFIITLAVALSARSQDNPNIILVMTDDLGWFDVGFNGSSQVKTPYLDKLAGEGIILSRFYSASAVCSPTRASVITGRNPLRMGIPTANSGHLPTEEVTLPELLKERGYATGHFGKWHLGTLTRNQLDANRGGREEQSEHYTLPTEHGYDIFFATESKVPTYDPMVFPTTFAEGENKRYGWKAVGENTPVEDYGTAYWQGAEQMVTENLAGDDSRIIMNRVLPFIKKSINNQRPFFATVWFHTPHLPVVSDESHRNLYPDLSLREQIYYGTISAMDEQMERLWQHLEELGIAENTMLWFCSDNGPERDTPGLAGIFRERKRSLHEGGVRVPAFVVWKSRLAGGRNSDFPMVTSDYLPTILDFLGIDYPDNRPLDGFSVRETLLEKSTAREQAIGFIFHNQISWVSHQYKLISKDQGQTFELYHLLDDPSETNNIIATEPAVANAMKDDLFAWLASVKKSDEGADY